MSHSVFRPDADYVRSLLRDLVRIDSVNPAFTGGRSDEQRIGAFVAEAMGALGLEVTTLTSIPERPSVVGRLPGGSGPTVMLYAHYDTVGVEGMQEPFSGEVRSGRLFGRGAYDMKGGLAACLGAVRAIRDVGAVLPGDVLVVAVADEEVASHGIQEVLATFEADAAIATEPTELAVCVAHKGFCWITVEVEGAAAHGSRPALGVDANMRMGRVLGRLERLGLELAERPGHALVGAPSLHAAVLNGGVGPSTYAPRSVLQIERRTVPDETAEQAVAEIELLIAELRREDPTLNVTCRPTLMRAPFEVAPDAAIVKAVQDAAASRLGVRTPLAGQGPWMDAAFLQGAGIDTVVIGPAGAGAHADEEWVDVESVVTLSGILPDAVNRYQGIEHIR